MGAPLSPVSDLVSQPLFSLPTFFSFLLPFSFLLGPYFPFNPNPLFSSTHTVPLTSPSPPITFFYPPTLISRSPCSDLFSSLLIRYHGKKFVAASLLRDYSRLSWKIGRASARVHAPPPSLFSCMSLLTPNILGFCPDLPFEQWLQILCFCADLCGGDFDESVCSSFSLSSFYNFRFILNGLGIMDLSTSCDFGVSYSNLTVSITVVVAHGGCAGFVVAREDEKIRKMCPEVWVFRPPSSLTHILSRDGLPCPPDGV